MSGKDEKRETVDMRGGAPVKVELCPHCGYDINEPPKLISEEDKKEYFRRMMAGEVFEKEYIYLKGDVRIKLRELTLEQTDRLVFLLRGVDDENTLLTQALRAKFVVCCTSFMVGQRVLVEEPVNDLKSIEGLNKAYMDTLGKLPPTMSHLPDDALTHFNTLLDGVIQAAVTSRDF